MHLTVRPLSSHRATGTKTQRKTQVSPSSMHSLTFFGCSWHLKKLRQQCHASGARTEAEAHSPHVCAICVFQGMCASMPVVRWHTQLLCYTPHLYVPVIHALWVSICDIAAQVSVSTTQVSASKARFCVYIARFREPMSPHNLNASRATALLVMFIRRIARATVAIETSTPRLLMSRS